MIDARATQAAVIRVPEDSPSVLAGIDAAVAGDVVLVGPGTWTDRDTRLVPIGGDPRPFTCCGFLKGGVSVIGRDGPDATIIDAGVVGPGFVIGFIFANSSQEAWIEGFTITGAGINGGAIFGDDVLRLTIRSCKAVKNSLGHGTAILTDTDTTTGSQDGIQRQT